MWRLMFRQGLNHVCRRMSEAVSQHAAQKIHSTVQLQRIRQQILRCCRAS